MGSAAAAAGAPDRYARLTSAPLPHDNAHPQLVFAVAASKQVNKKIDTRRL